MGFCLQPPPARTNGGYRKPFPADQGIRSSVLRSVSFCQEEERAARGGGGAPLGSGASVPLFSPFPVGWDPLRAAAVTASSPRRPPEVNSHRSLSISSAGMQEQIFVNPNKSYFFLPASTDAFGPTFFYRFWLRFAKFQSQVGIKAM